MASLDGGPIRFTVEGGGFASDKLAAIAADLAAGRIRPHEVPEGDGSKVCVTITGGTGDGPRWQLPPQEPTPVRLSVGAQETGDVRS